ncbi:hypothetical protein BDD12DRAFT_811356 [Trichophaea hybrida]|nr:hypothetical protein BDD12DRAFT_811356 [Trichophaea hybrida]
MAPRRSHKKSRAGCLRCKKRRIKCDEVHPSCGNCIKHAIECDFTLPPEECAALAPSAGNVGSSNSTSPQPPPPPPAVLTINNLNASVDSVPSQSPSQPHPSPSQPHPLPGPIHSPDLRPSISPSTPTSIIGANSTTDPVLLAADVKQPVAAALPPPSPALFPLLFGISSQQVLLQSAPQESLNMFDLSLMHNWSVSTAKTISNRKEIQELWRVNVPALAVQNPFLMHSILAISALHLQSTEQDHEKSIQYLTEAAHHQEQAVRGMGRSLAHISRDNCDALVASSSLVVIYSFVSSRIDEIAARPGPNPAASLASWVPFLRGVSSIVKQAWAWVSSGPLSPLIRQYELSSYTNSEGLDAETEGVLDNLYRLCTDRSLPGSEELSDTTISTVYFSAIAELRKSFDTIFRWEHLIGSIFVWPITAEDRFVELLVEGRPRALVIFMHYCALFTLVEEFWWAKGSALCELRRCEMCLGEEWKNPWIEWPKARILGRDVGRVVREC